MQISSRELDRFQLHGVLGEGADSEVFAGTDTQTGEQVVVKRPHPTLLARGQHRAVERRTAEVIAIKERLADALPHVSRMLAYTSQESHSDYFGDGLDAAYIVVVEARAVGVPLVGSALDGIKRQPIGLPQNLFALHPVKTHSERGAFAIASEVLEVAEAFHSQGALILDLRPQNVYFDPATAGITVIDVGNITQEHEATGRHAALDLHDFYLELFKWYVPSGPPPPKADDYCQPYGMDSVSRFTNDLDALSRAFASNNSGDDVGGALVMLERIRSRSYGSVAEFREDLETLMNALSKVYMMHADTQFADAWLEAANLMSTHHWSQYLFSPEDMEPYLNG